MILYLSLNLVSIYIGMQLIFSQNIFRRFLFVIFFISMSFHYYFSLISADATIKELLEYRRDSSSDYPSINQNGQR